MDYKLDVLPQFGARTRDLMCDEKSKLWTAPSHVRYASQELTAQRSAGSVSIRINRHHLKMIHPKVVGFLWTMQDNDILKYFDLKMTHVKIIHPQVVDFKEQSTMLGQDQALMDHGGPCCVLISGTPGPPSSCGVGLFRRPRSFSDRGGKLSNYLWNSFQFI